MWISSWPILPQEFLQRDHWHADLFLICIAIMRLQIRFAVLALILFSNWWATGSSPPSWLSNRLSLQIPARDWHVDLFLTYCHEIAYLMHKICMLKLFVCILVLLIYTQCQELLDESQWVIVMAACHCYLWWRRWQVWHFVSSSLKVMTAAIVMLCPDCCCGGFSAMAQIHTHHCYLWWR